MATPLQLEVIVEDLSFLYEIKMEWKGIDWETQFNRFENIKGNAIDFEYANAYWLPDWISVMVFRTYLSSIKAEFQILLDNAEGLDPFIIICDEEF
jgi:hypothetical protein